MVGLPKYCQTKSDWQYAVDFAVRHDTGKSELYERLVQLRDNHFMKVPKKSAAGKKPEDLTDEDYEDVENPAAEKYKLGFSDAEINQLLEVLK